MSQATAAPALDAARVRAAFPALHQEVNGRPLVYLDSAATTQKPTDVIEAVDRFYRRDCANVHRGVHALSQRATVAYESARTSVKRHLGARDSREIVFTRGTTEAINLVAHSFVRPRLAAGDEVLITAMEHHSNIVPWQLLCEERGATLPIAHRIEAHAVLAGLTNRRRHLEIAARLIDELRAATPADLLDTFEEVPLYREVRTALRSAAN